MTIIPAFMIWQMSHDFYNLMYIDTSLFLYIYNFIPVLSLSLSLSLSLLHTKYKLDLKCLLTILKFQVFPLFTSSFFTVFNSLYMYCNFQFKWWVLTILAISDYRLPRKLASLTLKSADPDTLTVLLRKHYVIHATISLGVLRKLYLYSDTKCMYTLF